MEAMKKTACDSIEKASEDLNDISQEIWKTPEENFEEHHAHTVLTDFLEKFGLTVERKFKLDTAFRAVYEAGSGGPNVAVLCEYDALPEIGHACGHNLIAEVGVAAGIAVKAALEASGKTSGKITVIGTPAEEGGGGKIDLINKGAFDGVDVAFMAHPCPINICDQPFLAIEPVTVKYHGKAVHASAFPWQGVNALDAAVLCYQNVSCMRQQMKPSWRVHGIIKNGGVKPNIIPDYTELEFYARTPKRAELKVLKEKLNSCFESAGKATGCEAEITWSGRPFYDVINNKPLLALYKKNADDLGVDFTNKHLSWSKGDFDMGSTGSTDMGNVTYVVPGIHPMYAIGTNALNHSKPFTAVAGSAAAQAPTITQGKALAMTAIDIFLQPEVLQGIKKAFEEDTAA